MPEEEVIKPVAAEVTETLILAQDDPNVIIKTTVSRINKDDIVAQIAAWQEKKDYAVRRADEFQAEIDSLQAILDSVK